MLRIQARSWGFGGFGFGSRLADEDYHHEKDWNPKYRPKPFTPEVKPGVPAPKQQRAWKPGDRRSW